MESSVWKISCKVVNLSHLKNFLYKIGRYPSAELDYNVIFNALKQWNIATEGMSSFDLTEIANELVSKSNLVIIVYLYAFFPFFKLGYGPFILKHWKTT